MPAPPRRPLRSSSAKLVVLAPYLWLVAFFLVPFLIVLKISLSQTAIAQPPYAAGARPRGRLAGHQGFRLRPLAGQLRDARLRRPLFVFLPAQPHRGGGVDRDPGAVRLPHRLCDGAGAAPVAAGAADARRAAVLDVVPHPGLRLDQHPAARRPPQPGAPCVGAHRSAAHLARDRHRDLYRPRLFVSAVHDPAALCEPREARRQPARGRRRPRLSALEGVLDGDGAAGAAGPRRRRAACASSRSSANSSSPISSAAPIPP